MAEAQEVTNAILSMKLDHITGLLEAHLKDDADKFQILFGKMHGTATDDPGVITRLDRLEQSDKHRKWLWGLVGGSILTQLGQWFTRH